MVVVLWLASMGMIFCGLGFISENSLPSCSFTLFNWSVNGYMQDTTHSNRIKLNKFGLGKEKNGSFEETWQSCGK